MIWTVELWVEGPTDAAEDMAEDSEQGGALPPLVRKTIREQSGISERALQRTLAARMRVLWLKSQLRKQVALPGRPTGLTNWARKLLMALDSSQRSSSQTVFVVVRDCDGQPDRLDARNEVHEMLRKWGWFGYVTAVCVEEVEAWLLADPAAFQLCFGHGPEAGLPGRPEDVIDPKTALRELVAELAGEHLQRRSEMYRDLAEHVDLKTLAQKCPKGYGQFQDDVREFIGPLLKNS